MRHRGQNPPYDPKRKTRTREHVIADLSYNFLERKVLQRGHWLDAPRNDYGIDATMFHHNENGEIENGEVRFQLKATDKLKTSKNDEWVSQRVETRDIRYWNFEPYPVIIVIYDAKRNRAFWLHIQEYVDEHPELIEADSDNVTLRIPTRNKLNLNAIDRLRKLSLKTVSQFQEIRRGSK